jgi:hypothetical protein
MRKFGLHAQFKSTGELRVENDQSATNTKPTEPSIAELCRRALDEGRERDAWRQLVLQRFRRTLGLPPMEYPEALGKFDSE